MTCKVVLEMKVKPDHVDEMLESVREMLPATHDYEGCIEVYIYQDQDDPTNLIAIQEWDRREHYEKYFAWRGEHGDLATLHPWVTQQLSPRFFDKKI